MLLEVNQIDTFYGVFQAVFQVSLRLDPGELVSLLGRNGAGKTTTLTSIVGLNPASRGKVVFKQKDITGLKPFQINRLGVSLIPENRWIFSELTVRENLELGRRRQSRNGNGFGLLRIYELFPKLKDLEKQLGGTLSGGEQQMLTIGRALMGNPELMLLDEPTAGLAPLVSQTLFRQLTQLKQEGITILLTEQNAWLALDISNRAYIMDKGTIVHEGPGQSLRQDQGVLCEYLGV
jgi:branched-chain amino acid transport system ATP-binding protein